jgi:alcohol dehydrogenase (cytochrome c)
LVGSARGDSVWLFALDGTLSPVEPGTPAPRTVPVPEGATPANSAAAAAADPAAFVAAADLANGQRVYERTCVLCHGEDGKGGHGTGAPLDAVTDLGAMVEAIQAGRNTMPSFSAALTADEIRDVSAYVWERL